MEKEQKEQLMKQGLEQGLIPSVLYRYTDLKEIKIILEKRTLKFSKRSAFNDVYECRGRVKTDYSQEDWERHYMELGASKTDAEALATVIMSDPSKQAQILDDAINHATDSLGILCLTQEKDNLLMWAHYADEHKGVCLEFSIGKALDTFCFPKRIDYSDDYPEIDFINNKKTTTDVIFHKSKAWEYEKEYRVVELGAYKDGDTGLFTKPLNPEALTGIYFGCNCSEDEINEIKSLAKNNGFAHVKFYRMERSFAEYELIARSI